MISANSSSLSPILPTSNAVYLSSQTTAALFITPSRPSHPSKISISRNAHSLMTESRSFPGTPLDHLTLQHCPYLSLPALLALLAQSAATLRHLHLNSITKEITDSQRVKFLHPQSLPKLERLILSTTCDARLLRLFADAPLAELHVRFCPQISMSDWEEFIEEYSLTLRKVTFLQAFISIAEAADRKSVV